MKKVVGLLVKTSKNLYGKREKHICNDCDKIHPSLEPPMTHSPHKKKLPMIPSLLKWANNNDVDQCANAINQQNNVNLSSKRLKRMR